MNNYRHSRHWLLQLAIIAAIGTFSFPALVTAESENPDALAEETMETTDSPDSGADGTSEDTNGNAETALPESLTDTSEPEEEPELDAEAKEQLAWDNFMPPPDSKFDWIQLNSGEWLKGELKTTYDYQMEFDSDELGLLSLDLADIKRVRTARIEAVRYQGPRDTEPATAVGLLTVDGNTVTVGSGADARRIRRGDVISIAKSAERERDLWTGSLSIGANYRSGNSDLTDMNITGRAERRRAISRYVAEYLGNFSSAQGVETSNNHRLTTYFDSFRTSKLYWRIASLEYVRDTFRNIDHQANLNTGIGYDLIRSAKKDWDVTASVGALYAQFVSVQSGSPLQNTSPALSLGTRYDHEVTSWLDFLFDYRLQIVDEDNGTLIHHMLSKISTEFINDLDFEISFIWDRVKDPQPEADGTVPQQDDFQTIFGIGYEF